MPQMRNCRSYGASFAATCVGVKKNTRFCWNAFSTSAVATPRPATPAAIHNALLVLGFKVSLLFDPAQGPCAPDAQGYQLGGERDGGRAVRHPDEIFVAHAAPRASSRTQRVRASRSMMIERTRTRAAPMEYIQQASAMSNMPHSIATCIEVPLKLTLE